MGIPSNRFSMYVIHTCGLIESPHREYFHTYSVGFQNMVEYHRILLPCLLGLSCGKHLCDLHKIELHTWIYLAFFLNISLSNGVAVFSSHYSCVQQPKVYNWSLCSWVSFLDTSITGEVCVALFLVKNS